MASVGEGQAIKNGITGQKWLKMAKNGIKWLKMAKNGIKWQKYK